MNIFQKKEISKAIKYYAEKTELNKLINDNITLPIELARISAINPSAIKENSEIIQQAYRHNGIELAEEQAIINYLLTIFLMECKTFDLLSPELILEIVKHSKIFHKNDLLPNPYIHNINVQHIIAGKYKTTRKTLERYELFLYNEDTNIDNICIPSIGVTDFRFQYPAITQNNKTIIQVSPTEIYSTQPYINKATGNVLILGCELGYFAYMCSEKPDVHHITIVENTKEKIKIFKKTVITQFTHRYKINIIQENPYEYIKKLNDETYDYCFVNLCKNRRDAEPYIKLKEISNKFTKMHIDYYMENQILSTLINFIPVILQNKTQKQDNKSFTSTLTDEEKYAFQHMRYLLKDVEINSEEDVGMYMDSENIKTLLSKKGKI